MAPPIIVLAAKYALTSEISGPTAPPKNWTYDMAHAYRLDTPSPIHPVFLTSLLRPAHDDPLPSQILTDWQPPAIVGDGEEEFHVEAILDERRIRWGRGHPTATKMDWLSRSYLDASAR
ncbi:hypothetical protein POJ06DRAFT_136044 [Lipomyces tetrasporus]|uniref:Uncharacterized protein n=1 Tax=Lipomyces tetrasporus TaxID=54092 RepID=A0AAD7QQ32_9ASCO|nr:uncharacterized protein POJ06DRAFT_136044 [Lipomyces tetrasporus]KAJ8099492.1 hypothetical protein POJ06DRAFT_136044 [Lipomyces tetrasporus]